MALAGESKKDQEDTVGEMTTTKGTETKENKKKRGVISRIWNRLIRLHGGDDFEKRLQHISKEEAALLVRMKKRSQSWRRMARDLIIFSVIFELRLIIGLQAAYAAELELTEVPIPLATQG
ncbi:unnamed protein product [Ilex paraguariensis]|uniref:Uncharacterized protein n=1 Tax=Ilex paraguariensis TaxID=185542 RepID=A0ABC8QYA4_9AQUA